MNENMKKLLELVKNDESLRQSLKGAKDKDAVIAVAAERGITLTDADFELSEEDKKAILAEGGATLSDDELEAVAGGKGDCTCIIVGPGSNQDGGTSCVCVMVGGGDQLVCWFAGD